MNEKYGSKARNDVFIKGRRRERVSTRRERQPKII
jgi:hypothetical protein